MRISRHKRQLLLFFAAILIPAGVLVGLAGRMMYQDRELAGKREADQRRTAIDQLRRELGARLEAIKLLEIYRLMQPGNTASPGNPAVLFSARLEGDRLLLPWEAPA